MTGFKLLLVFSLSVLAQQCDITASDIEAFEDKVTVTNASSGRDALVIVSLDHSWTGRQVKAGSSFTATSLLATTFSVQVTPHQSASRYRERLVSLMPGGTPDQVADVAADLLLVVGALQQLGDVGSGQSCSGAVEFGVENYATVQFTKASDGTELWSLDCG